MDDKPTIEEGSKAINNVTSSQESRTESGEPPKKVIVTGAKKAFFVFEKPQQTSTVNRLVSIITTFI